MPSQRLTFMVPPPWSFPRLTLAFQGSQVGHEAKATEEEAKILLETPPSFLSSTPPSTWSPT